MTLFDRVENIGIIKASPTTPVFWVALLRILMGIMFIAVWYSNLQKGFYTPDGLQDFFTNVFPQSANPLTWYAAFIDGVILPIRDVFAPFQLVTELLMGIALLIGFFSRASAVAAAFFILNTFLASFGADWPFSYINILAILGVIFFTKAGRSIGVDALLVKRFGETRLPLW
jgi:uncharacterized membrane protein YphA (DoxX/SURF4 family)